MKRIATAACLVLVTSCGSAEDRALPEWRTSYRAGNCYLQIAESVQREEDRTIVNVIFNWATEERLTEREFPEVRRVSEAGVAPGDLIVIGTAFDGAYRVGPKSVRVSSLSIDQIPLLELSAPDESGARFFAFGAEAERVLGAFSERDRVSASVGVADESRATAVEIRHDGEAFRVAEAMFRACRVASGM